ncbi:hypothetical protein PVAND_009139 [Polypedilum vanderplanki]|uniref:Pacifastin domain-containing protein n=1 Tax=Polypedilum vanderplanki TaxID=319348 RepID=A0A9J6CCV9_POLVA|nr:hypothetical protein PVAND_009139 [Polypedilum vanderplanki]
MKTFLFFVALIFSILSFSMAYNLSRNSHNIKSEGHHSNALEQEHKEILQFIPGNCTALETKFIRCNFCKCTKSGNGMFCTQKECEVKN